jgi:hypothetical protein
MPIVKFPPDFEITPVQGSVTLLCTVLENTFLSVGSLIMKFLKSSKQDDDITELSSCLYRRKCVINETYGMRVQLWILPTQGNLMRSGVYRFCPDYYIS